MVLPSSKVQIYLLAYTRSNKLKDTLNTPTIEKFYEICSERV